MCVYIYIYIPYIHKGYIYIYRIYKAEAHTHALLRAHEQHRKQHLLASWSAIAAARARALRRLSALLQVCVPMIARLECL